jgi:hypothetical protein
MFVERLFAAMDGRPPPDKTPDVIELAGPKASPS